MYNGNVQQNPRCVESCVTKKFSMSPLFSSTIFDPDANSVLLRAHLCTAVDSVHRRKKNVCTLTNQDTISGELCICTAFNTRAQNDTPARLEAHYARNNIIISKVLMTRHTYYYRLYYQTLLGKNNEDRRENQFLCSESSVDMYFFAESDETNDQQISNIKNKFSYCAVLLLIHNTWIAFLPVVYTRTRLFCLIITHCTWLYFTHYYYILLLLLYSTVP